MREIGIYKITSPSGKIYIGQSNNLKRRKSDYKNGHNYEYQSKLANSLKKYGWKSHVFEIIENCSEELLNERERYWQDFYDCIKNGLNCRLTKTSDKSGKLSEETKKKMSEAAKGKPKSLEARQKQAKTRTGMKGYQPTPEECKQRSERQKGRKNSPEWIENMRKGQLEYHKRKKEALQNSIIIK